jgi:hypothetical protein
MPHDGIIKRLCNIHRNERGRANSKNDILFSGNRVDNTKNPLRDSIIQKQNKR